MKRIFRFAGWVLMTLTASIGQEQSKPRVRAETRNGGTPAPPLEFAVASIRLIKFGAGPHSVHVVFTPDGLLDEGVPLNIIVRAAFDVSDDRVLGLPDWARREPYYIEAKVDPVDVPRFDGVTKQQKWAMVLALFEDRLALRFHHETREEPVYTLVIAKGGPKMKKSASTENGKDGRSTPPKVSGSKDGLHAEESAASMANVVDLLSKILKCTVIDKTGLVDHYDLTLDYLPESMGLAPIQPPATAPPSVFTAIQEQLGLKLESGKDTVDVIVIDHIEQPSPN
jgi:uncharacterized protein (TIGR03435 family)